MMIIRIMFSIMLLGLVLACGNRSEGATRTGEICAIYEERVDTSASVDRIAKSDFDGAEESESIEALVLPDLLRNKVYFRVRESDTCLYVYKGYAYGLSGYRFEDSKMKSFGAESFVVEIDSVQGDSVNYQLYTSRSYLNVFDEVCLDTFSYEIVFLQDRMGFMTINHNSLFVDSVFLSAHQIPIVEEEPYDINEAWANDPANQ